LFFMRSFLQKTNNENTPMKTRFIASNAAFATFAVLLLSLMASGAFAPKAFAQGRVSAYKVTTPELAWNDLSESDNADYIYSQMFYYQYTTTSLPFNFNYDNTTKSSGTTLTVGPGWLSFGSVPQYQQYGGLGNTSYPGVMDFFGATYVSAGTGEYPGYDDYGVYTEVDGTAPNRVFTIQWTATHLLFYTGIADNGDEYLCNMQVKLYEGSNVIQFLYQNTDQYMYGYAEYGSYYAIGYGLNGFTSPSFTDLVYNEGVDYTPSSDLQFAPPAPPQELSLQPKSLNFGTATPGTPVTEYVTAKSAGGAGSTLHITGMSVSGSQYYTITSGPPVGTALPVGSSVQYGITFQPFSNGGIDGIFTLNTDGVDSGTQSVTLSGVGAVPTVAYSANSMFRGVDVELTHTSGIQYLYVNSVTPPGGGPVTVNQVYFIGLNANNYTLTHVPAGGIAPGGVDSIGVQFSPTIEGLPDAHLVINTNATNIPWDTVTMDGVGILPHLAVDSAKSWPLPTTINFDSVKLGSDSTITVQLSNPGSDTIAIEKNFFVSHDPDFTLVPVTGSDTLIPPGGSQNIEITFTPQQQGTRVATIRILTDIPHTETTPPQDTSEFVINIVGVGVPTGKLRVTGPAQNDSALLGKSACQTDTLWNTGDAAITVTGVTITGTNAADFTSSGLTLPLTLAANSGMPFEVCADPSQMGAESAVLTATGTSSESPTTASLILGVFGQSIADTIIVTQPFSAVSCGSDMETVTVTNTGNVPESYTSSISLNDNFTVTPASSPVESAGGVATFTVVFNETQVGAATQTLSFTSSSGGTQSIQIAANGGAATITGTGAAPMTSIGFTSAAFPVVVNNTGSCSWTSGPPTVDPQFTYMSGSGTIDATTGTATFMFTYTPTVAGGATYPVTFTASTGLTTSPPNVTITTGLDAVAPEAVSNGFSLEQNYPNPFSGTSNVEITLPVGCLVHLAIVNVEGQVVQTVLNQHYDAGSFEITLDATGLASGTYYYQMTAGDVTLTRQMVVVK
jgi:hypothetical protein